MDGKALAKSKRAHSLHHSKKSHSSHRPKPSSDGSSGNPKPSGKQVGEKGVQPRRVPRLPSNWDRYEEEFDLGSEPSGDVATTSQLSDAVVPKSKGADYRHLIAEAQAESQSKLNLYSDGVPSLDDVLPDEFSQLVGSMLSARGEGILSWIEDDNFIVEDGTAPSHEAAFLSLNLNALAEQLEKVDLSQRLFIEADLLPPELRPEPPKASHDQKLHQLQATHKSSDTTIASEEPSLQDFADKPKIVDERSETSLPVPPNESLDPPLSNVELNAVNEGTGGSHSAVSEESPQSKKLDLLSELKLNTIGDSKKESSTYQASSAEAELDMLLDSLGETKFQEPPRLKTQNASSYAQKEASRPFPQHSATSLNPSAPAASTASFDDVLDDLLEQTSGTAKQKGVSLSRQQENQTSSSQSVRKPKALDDFDSWLDTI